MTATVRALRPPRSGFLVDTPVARSECARCGGTVLQAWCCGIATVLDPLALDLIGEVTARLAGRYSFALRPSGSRFRLELRDAMSINGDLTKGRPVVMAEHRCPA